MGVLTGDKHTPALFVGLGGNGSTIVNLLASRVTRHEHWDRIQSLTHFVILDTNKADLDRQRAVRPDCRFLIAGFDARGYVELKQGHREVPEDTLLTQWWPEWYQPRGGGAAGAGQIRAESRLKLWYSLENDLLGIRAKLNNIFQEMTHLENPWRDNQDRRIRIYIYGSVAGGTGSGSFLPMAYLLRQMVEDAGDWRAEITGVLSLPTTFLHKVRPELHNDIASNGYAALKELEYLTRMLGYQGGVDEMEFHVEPGTPDPRRRKVRGRPFSLTYLIDRPQELSIDKFTHAVADASYLQIFSPLLGEQAGEYDNYEKHQRTLAQGHFAVTYGSFGIALLHFPRQDVLRYAGLRFAARALGDWLSFGAADPEFRVPWGDPKFQRLADDEKNTKIDGAFERFVASRADQEKLADERGVFTQIEELRGKGNTFLPQKLHEELQQIYAKLDEIIEISPIDPMAINTANPSIHRPLANLREDYAKSLEKVNLELDARLSDLESGKFLQRFFTEYQVNPIAQRLLLIRELKKAFITPSVPADPKAERGEGDEEDRDADWAFLSEKALPVDFDGEHVRAEGDRANTELRETSTQSMFAKLRDRDNQAFQMAKRKAVGFVEGLEADCRDHLKRSFWQQFQSRFRQVAETVLGSFRQVAEISDGEANRLSAQADRFRRDPGSFEDSQIAQYYLDHEVLKDDRADERLWDWLFTHLLDKEAYFDTDKLFRTVTEAFQPVRDPSGQMRARDAVEIVGVVRDALIEQASGIFGGVLENEGMNLQRGLELEQRYIALAGRGHTPEALRQAAALDLEVDQVSNDVVIKGIRDRLIRLDQACVVLANIERRHDQTVVPADVRYVGLAEQFMSDESDALGSILKGSISKINTVPEWSDRDSMVMYKAMLGVPVYWFKNVGSILEPAYKQVISHPNRSYPLHIESEWEPYGDHDGIPNLDPIEIQKAEIRRKEAEVAAAAANARTADLRAFTLASLFGYITKDPEGFVWSASESTGKLGHDRRTSYEAYGKLPPPMRELFDEPAAGSWAAGLATKKSRADLTSKLEAHAKKLKAAMATAFSEEEELEYNFITDEHEVVKTLLQEVNDR